jgi:hypothetical protein
MNGCNSLFVDGVVGLRTSLSFKDGAEMTVTEKYGRFLLTFPKVNFRIGQFAEAEFFDIKMAEVKKSVFLWFQLTGGFLVELVNLVKSEWFWVALPKDIKVLNKVVAENLLS